MYDSLSNMNLKTKTGRNKMKLDNCKKSVDSNSTNSAFIKNTQNKTGISKQYMVSFQNDSVSIDGIRRKTCENLGNKKLKRDQPKSKTMRKLYNDTSSD